MGQDFIQLSGEDMTALGFNRPWRAWLHFGDLQRRAQACCPSSRRPAWRAISTRALTYQDRLMPLHRALFLEPSPAGVKYARPCSARCTAEVRLPLVRRLRAGQGEIRAAMVHAGLI